QCGSWTHKVPDDRRKWPASPEQQEEQPTRLPSPLSITDGPPGAPSPECEEKKKDEEGSQKYGWHFHAITAAAPELRFEQHIREIDHFRRAHRSTSGWVRSILVIPFGRCSGGGGIRTHGQAEPVNGFQDRPDQPLWHPSGSSDKMANGKWQMANGKGKGKWISSDRRLCRSEGRSLADLVDDVFGHVDRHVDGHGQGDGVAGARIDLDELAVVSDPQLGEIGVLAQLVDVNVLQLPSQKLDRVRQQVMSQRALGRLVLDAPVDARGLENADHDREHAIAFNFLEENDMLIAILVDDDPHEFHLDRHGKIPLSAGSRRLIAGRASVAGCKAGCGSRRVRRAGVVLET